MAGEPRWQQIPTATPSIVYVDMATAGDGPWTQRRVWIKRDHPTRTDGVRADRVLYVFDCERSTFAVKSVINYAQPGAQGYPLSSILHTDAQLQFVDVTPQTISEALAALACRR